GWQRDRLFSAVAELLDAVAGESGFVAVIEDVHWADGATLDCLTYLARAGWRMRGVLAGWRRSGWGRCRGSKRRSRSPGWWVRSHRAGSLRICTSARRVTRFSPSSWWLRRWPARAG